MDDVSNITNCDEYKIGSDIIQQINYIDENNEPILFNDLEGYGIKIYNPKGEVIGMWGVNLKDFIIDENIFKITDINQITLYLSLNIYGSCVGIVTAELYIKYYNDNFINNFRFLWSDKKKIFKLRY